MAHFRPAGWPRTLWAAGLFVIVVLTAMAVPAVASARGDSATTGLPIPLVVASGDGSSQVVAGEQAAAAAQTTANASAISNGLKSVTGYTSSEVTSRDACGAARVGYARCLAQVLVSKATGAQVRPVHLRRGREATYSTKYKRAASAALATSTAAASQQAPQEFTPAYIQSSYDLSWLSQTGGSGDTIGIVDAYDDPDAEADLQVYRAEFGLPTCDTANGCFEEYYQGATEPQGSTTTTGNWAVEESLDLDAVSAACPNCSIVFVEAQSNSMTNLEAAAQLAATEGADQISMSFGDAETPSQYGGGFSFSGVSSLAATGDDGYTSESECGRQFCAQFPAADPNVTAVGGTTLTPETTYSGVATSGYSRGVDETGWDDGGSGCNDDSAEVPSYQGAYTTGCNGRAYSDISSDGNPSTGLDVYDSIPFTDSSDPSQDWTAGWGVVGGTSLATPLSAAYEALTDVQSGSPTDEGPTWAYTTDASDLNDITSPTTNDYNGNCGADDRSGGQLTRSSTEICTIATGYDGPTGIGSISGDVVAGAPVIASSVDNFPGHTGETNVTLAGGVYANGQSTTCYFEYSTDQAFDSPQTASCSGGASGAGVTAVTGSIPAPASGSTTFYRLVATNPSGTAYGPTYAISNAPPTDTVAPSISGTASQGQTLTINAGTWSNAGVISYQWYEGTSNSSCSSLTAIPGATATTYTLGNSDIGDYLCAAVTETNDQGASAEEQTSITARVVAAAPSNTVAPSISGTLVENNALTADVGTWVPTGTQISYQWWEETATQYTANPNATCGTGSFTAISNATGNTYTLGSGDVGDYLCVEITETNATGSNDAVSAVEGPVAYPPPSNSSAPNLTDITEPGAQPVQGDWLTIAPGAWNTYGVTGGGVAYTWQYSANGTSGWTTLNPSLYDTTTNTYVLQSTDAGEYLRVQVTYTDSAGSTTVDSNVVGAVLASAPVNTVSPEITGTAEQGDLLTADPGTWDPAQLGATNNYVYAWYSCQAAQSTASTPTQLAADCTAVGTGASTYTPVASDVGDAMFVVVSDTNPGSATGTATAWTGSVAPPAPVNQTAPSLTDSTQSGGQIVQDDTLTIAPGTWSTGGLTATADYEWQESATGTGGWTDVTGMSDPATSTYTLQSTDVGTYLRVLVTETDSSGSSAQVASNVLGLVLSSAPTNSVAPSINGTPEDGVALTTNPGTWMPSEPEATNTYVWYSCPSGTSTSSTPAQLLSTCTAVGTDSDTYTPGSSDVGNEIFVVVSDTNPGSAAGVATAWTSSTVAPPPPFNTGGANAPSLSDNTQSGTVLDTDTLMINPGTWSTGGLTATAHYTWQEYENGSWTTIPGYANTTSNVYALSATDRGNDVRVLVTETDSSGTGAPASSNSLGPVYAIAPTLGAVSVNGTTQDGQTLTISGTSDAWESAYTSDEDPSATYTWYACPASTVSGASVSTIEGTCVDVGSGTSYQLTSADVGDEMFVVETGSYEDSLTSSAASEAGTGPIAALAPSNTALPQISGQTSPLYVGTLLSVSAGSWSPSGTPGYTWFACSAYTADFSGCSVTSTASTFAPTAAVANDYIGAAVTETNDGVPVTVDVGPVGPVTIPLKPSIVTAANLSGAAKVAGTITVTGGAFDNGTVTAVSFFRCGKSCTLDKKISSSGGASYKPVHADAGHYIRAQYTISGIGGTTTAWASGLIGPVVSPTTGATQIAAMSTAKKSKLVIKKHVVLSGSSHAKLLAVKAAASGKNGIALNLTPEKGNKKVSAWVCTLKAGAVAACTAARAVTKAPAKLTFKLAAGEKAELIVIKP